MADITDDTKTFTIALTGAEEPEEPEPSIAPWVALGAAAIGLYLLLR